jgi:hypothetical protein
MLCKIWGFHGADYDEDYEVEREVGSSEKHYGWGEQKYKNLGNFLSNLASGLLSK